MYTLKASLLILICLTFSFCSDSSEQFPMYELELNETIAHDANLDVTFTAISDSRCPIGVECVWEGQADVTLDLTFFGDLVTTIHLIERAGHPELADTVVGDYLFRLIEVTPYPVYPDTIALEDYRVHLEITN